MSVELPPLPKPDDYICTQYGDGRIVDVPYFTADQMRAYALKALKLTEEKTPMDAFENAIRSVGVVAACEWFGYAADSDFTKETARVLEERAHGIGEQA